MKEASFKPNVDQVVYETSTKNKLHAFDPANKKNVKFGIWQIRF